MYSPAVALFLAGLVSAVFAGGCGPLCPGGYLNWEDDCYKLYDVAKTWEEAEKQCGDDGAHLASIHSAAENGFVDLLSGQGKAGSEDHTWIGFNDHKKEGHFVWTDGSPVNYKNWHNKEPNNAGKNGEQCTELNFFGTRGTWNDHFCTRKHRFICKMPPLVIEAR